MNLSKPLISVVVPIYNMEVSISECVNSLIHQEYENIEIILVDDGSKDDSYRKCVEIAKKDTRIIVFHTENRGAGPARNYGIEHASGKYIYFPDADDLLEPRAISKMVSSITDGDVDLVVFGYRSVNQSGKTVFEKNYKESDQKGNDIRKSYSDYMLASAKWGIQGAPWNKLFSMEVIRLNNIRYPSLRRHQDEGFIGLFMSYANNIKFIPGLLYTHYVNSLKLEWEKYPVDYIDSVIGLFNIRKVSILTWNKADSKTNDIVTNSYICNVIKALELSFSPKHDFSRKQRLNWIVNTIDKTELSVMIPPKITGKYQLLICSLVRSKMYKLSYFVLKCKVYAEKSKILEIVRGK